MRHAPPVRIVIVEPAAWRAFQATLWAVSAGTVATWIGLHAGLAPSRALALACTVAAGVAAGAAGRPAGSSRVLAWDGSRWSLDGIAGRARLMVDAGGWLLMRFADTGSRRRTWLAAAPDGDGGTLGARHALRVALHALRPSGLVASGIEADRAV